MNTKLMASVSVLALVLAGCASNEPKPFVETPEVKYMGSGDSNHKSLHGFIQDKLKIKSPLCSTCKLNSRSILRSYWSNKS